jgi:putative hydrolase of the HAD superfamily
MIRLMCAQPGERRPASFMVDGTGSPPAFAEGGSISPGMRSRIRPNPPGARAAGTPDERTAGSAVATPPPVRVVCFDLGGVVVRIVRSWREACALAGLPIRACLESPGFRQEIHLLDTEHQTGRVADPEFLSRLATTVRGSYTLEEVACIHDGWILGEYDGLEGLIAELDEAGLETACLSNTNARHWDWLEGRRAPDGPLRGAAPRAFPAFLRIRHRLASHLLGAMKPDPEIWRAFEARTGFRGPEILFFDDLPVNTAGARAAGWRAEEVDSGRDTAVQIRDALRRHGVL